MSENEIQRQSEKDFICLFETMKKEASNTGPVSFVVNGRNNYSNKIRITGEYGSVEQSGSGKEVKLSDRQMRKYISQMPSIFERLFIEATQKRHEAGFIKMKLTLAKLADISALCNEKMPIDMGQGQVKKEFIIWRDKEKTRFELNGKELTEDEAYSFVKNNQAIFLINMKSGIKTVRKRAQGIKGYTYSNKRSIDKNKKLETKDGKLRVNLDSHFQKKEAPSMPAYKKREIQNLKNSILKNNKSDDGYVTDN